MILLRIGIDVVFISEDTPSITPYTCYYLSGQQIGDKFQFFYHTNAIGTLKPSSYYKNYLGEPFNDVSLQEFIDSLDSIEYVPEAIGFVFVARKEDLPDPVSGVITLKDNYTYFFTNDLDLEGDRIVCGSDTTILGGSSENCSITSTGLGAGVALLTSEYTTPIREITLKDVDTALDFDGTVNTMALDWTGVNFENIPNIGIVSDFTNFVFTKGAFLNAKGLFLDGEFDTLAFNNSFFQGDGLLGNIIEIPSTAIINRRFRIIYSSVVAFGSTTAINVSTSATIPDEGYILDTVNFSGGSTYTAGVQYNNNKALFRFCRGINNSTEVSEYYMSGNNTATNISNAGTPVKAEGVTTSSIYTEKFNNTDNRATYTGALTRIFKVIVTASMSSGNNKDLAGYIYKNGSQVMSSKGEITTSGNGSAEVFVIQSIVELATDDYIEFWVEQNTNPTSNITVINLNVTIE